MKNLTSLIKKIGMGIRIEFNKFLNSNTDFAVLSAGLFSILFGAVYQSVFAFDLTMEISLWILGVLFAITLSSRILKHKELTSTAIVLFSIALSLEVNHMDIKLIIYGFIVYLIIIDFIILGSYKTMNIVDVTLSALIVGLTAPIEFGMHYLLANVLLSFLFLFSTLYYIGLKTFYNKDNAYDKTNNTIGVVGLVFAFVGKVVLR